ncbi:uncharacterized protein [Nicotiana tomentosiformis]|uniref:uncharacterized protein n=1 Tax=Nicotiana tomentosiformis TaxID=4098 RepID=UPI00388CC6A0
MPDYAKFMKDLVTKKRSMNFETIKVTDKVSAIFHSMDPKLEDPSAFTIPCTIGSAEFAKALCDLGESINFMPYSIFKTLGIGQPRPTLMRLQMADRTMKRLLGVIEVVLVRVDKFILQRILSFYIVRLIMKCQLFLGDLSLLRVRLFVMLKTNNSLFGLVIKKVVFYVCKSMWQPNSNEVCSFEDLVTDVIVDDTSSTINVGDMLEAVFLKFDDDEMDVFMECLNSMQRKGSYNYAPQKWSLDLENRKTPPKSLLLKIHLP